MGYSGGPSIDLKAVEGGCKNLEELSSQSAKSHNPASLLERKMEKAAANYQEDRRTGGVWRRGGQRKQIADTKGLRAQVATWQPRAQGRVPAGEEGFGWSTGIFFF